METTRITIKRLSYAKKEKLQFFEFNFSNKTLHLNLEKIFEKTSPPMVFNFEIDIFQKMAIKCIELEKNILVAAHTSSGKTLVAEYAISKSIKNNKRVIYTTPIKALSNQKFKDLKKIFSDVGLVTGDLSINFNGKCIVMTTEILRCILGGEKSELKNLSWIIVDEAHYLKDNQRGFIWEEIFILLPKTVKIICLSATMPNVIEFSEWLTQIRKSNFVSIVAQKRPVPLKEYFCFPEFCGLKLFRVCDKNLHYRKLKFTTKNKNKSISSIDLFFKKNLKLLVSKLYKIGYGPVIIFTFSKKKCQEFAENIYSENYVDEKSMQVIERFLDKLTINHLTDRSFRYSYKNQFCLLKKGIGVHHGNLSPFLKEITEILFQSNLLYVLFATETFSIGLNMPSRTVIFSSLVKFDGKYLRLLNRSEFIQMSGRAGRRGIDKKGIVISFLNKNTDFNKIKKVLNGYSEPIGSVFKLTVNTFLDFIGPKKQALHKLLKNSFFKFQRKTFTSAKFLIKCILKKRKKLLVFPKSTLVYRISNAIKQFKKVLIFEPIINRLVYLLRKNFFDLTFLNYKFEKKFSLNFNEKWLFLCKENSILQVILLLFKIKRKFKGNFKSNRNWKFKLEKLIVFKNEIPFKVFFFMFGNFDYTI